MEETEKGTDYFSRVKNLCQRPEGRVHLDRSEGIGVN